MRIVSPNLLKGIIDPNGGTMSRFALLVCPLAFFLFPAICILQRCFFSDTMNTYSKVPESLFATFSSHCAAVLFAVVFSCIFILFSSKSLHRSCTVISLTIALTSGLSNMLISLGLSPVSSYSASTAIVVHFRYAEWMVCLPLMAFAVADFLRPKFLFIGIGLQFLTVLLGYIADVLILQWAKILFFGIAFLLYVFLNITIYLVCIAVSNYQNMINGSKSECTHYFELSQGSIKTLGFGIGIMLSVVVGWFSFAQLGVIPQEIHFVVSPFVDMSAHCYFIETWHVNERSWSRELIQSLSESLATTPKRLFSPRRRYQKHASNKVIPTKERQRKKHSNDSDQAAAIRPLRNRSLELPLSSPPSLSSKDCNEFPSQDSNPSGSGRVNKSRSRPVNWNRIIESSKSNDDTLPCVSTSLDRTGSFFFGRKSLRLSLHRSTRMSPKNGELQVWGEAGSDSKPSSRGSFNSSLAEDSCSQGQSKSSLELKRTRGKSLTASQHSKNSNSLGCLKSSFLSSSKSSHLAMSTSKNNHSVDSMERSMTGVRTDVMPLSILRSGHSFSERAPKSLRISTHYAEPKDDTHPLQGFKEATSVVSSPAMKNIGMEHETPLALPLMRTNHQELEPLQTLHSKAEKGFNTTAVLSARPSPSKKKRELDNRRHSLQSPAYCFQEQEPVQNMLARKDHQPASAILLARKTKNILIVDDVHSNVKLAEMILKKAEYCCDLAYNGLEAVNAAHLKHYDLILMDNVMPIMNGIEATKKILLLKPDALIVGLTGNILPLDQEEFLRAGAKLILPKPIERIQLLETCNRFCSK